MLVTKLLEKLTLFRPKSSDVLGLPKTSHHASSFTWTVKTLGQSQKQPRCVVNEKMAGAQLAIRPENISNRKMNYLYGKRNTKHDMKLHSKAEIMELSVEVLHPLF